MPEVRRRQTRADRPEVREPSAKRLVVYAMAAKTLNFLIMAGSTLIVSPLLLRHLGLAKYGSWALIAQLTGYYGLLDWGLRGAVSYFVAAYYPKERFRELNSIISAAFYALVVVGGIAIAIGLGLAFMLEKIFNLSGTNPVEVRSAFVVVTLTVACSLPFEGFFAVVYGRKRPYLLAAADSIAQVLSATAIVAVVSRGGGLVPLAIIQALSRLGTWAVATWNARRLLPTLRLSIGLIDKAAVKEVAHYGSRNFFINLAQFVVNRVDLVVVGAVLDVTMVTRYAIGQTLVEYASVAVSNVTQAFTPHFAHAHGEGASSDIRRYYVRGAQLSGTVAMLLAGGLFAYGSSFIRLWLGEELLLGAWWQRSDAILVVLLVGQLPRFTQSISWQLFFGVRDVNFVTIVQVAEATLNLVLSMWWVHTMGPIGVALGSTVPLLITNLFVMPRRVCRLLQMPAREYVTSCVLPGASVGVVVFASGFALTMLAAPAQWFLFVAEVVTSGSLAALVAVRLVSTREERISAFAAAKRFRRRVFRAS
jgi:O-antigen/teichoic acid export membrane protein